ncbi:hypothetical protein XELAEV_18029403mg [Xenopus laevis]|uniref:Helix-turn-helix domain-containing protein n=1 Tax=Xenopus laevis TaxID=8355 RepID=A0A974CTU4_XENLA|nr:hypothetical protein XELAEV_18029403mg [Xenopus laevis]
MAKFVDILLQPLVHEIGSYVQDTTDYLQVIDSFFYGLVHYDTNSIQFLDVMVYKDLSLNKLQTKIYQKPTDRNTLLHYSSSHPRHLLDSLPRSQMLRAIRITNDEQERNVALNRMASQFLEREIDKICIGHKRNKNLKELLSPMEHFGTLN